MSIEMRFESAVNGPLEAVAERALSVAGANDELWPMATVTFSVPLDRDTVANDVVGRRIDSWIRGFGVVPFNHRAVTIEAFEPTKFRECSDSWLQGHVCHERTCVATGDHTTLVTDVLVAVPRGPIRDALLRISTTTTFRRRHRRLQRHFDRLAVSATSTSS